MTQRSKSQTDRFVEKNMYQKELPLITRPYSSLFPSHSLEAAQTAFPLFGGTASATTDTEDPPAETDGNSPTAASDDDAGGSSGTPESMSPEQVSDLLKTVGDLTKKIASLTDENNSYKNKDQQAQRAQQTREQQLESDLQERDQIIAKMDACIRHAAIINAIQGMKDMEWHSARHVMNELNMESFDLDVDLENGTATVNGIEGELKRVAKECPWLVSKDKTRPSAGQQPVGTTRPRGSGSPPAPPAGATVKETKRAELINKYPVIAHGRGR